MVAKTEVRPIQLTEDQVFVNGDMRLSDTGNKLQSLARNLSFLNEGWEHEVKVPAEAALHISRGRQAEIIDDLAETLVEVSDALGFEPDMSLVPGVVLQYGEIYKARQEGVQEVLKGEFHELTAGRPQLIQPKQIPLWK